MAKIIQQDTVNNVLSYLATRPWNDVNPLIVSLLNLPEVPEVESKPETENTPAQ